MGTPVTIDNYKQINKDRIEQEFNKYKARHQAWVADFEKAEQLRREEEKEWRDFYFDVYTKENVWWKSAIMFALNGIQLWALFTQYKQQKEIADRTYNLANRQLGLAEEMYKRYKEMFQPHEVAIGEQINNYFANPYKPQYDITSGRFALNARMQMIGKRREVLMCASQYCTGAIRTSLQDLALQEARLVSNAMNSGVKFEKLREHKLLQKWLNARLTFIQAGRGVASQGITGLESAGSAFHSFGADPGAALSQLLTTVAHTVGGFIDRPTAPHTPAPVVDAQPAWTKPRPSTRVTRTE